MAYTIINSFFIKIIISFTFPYIILVIFVIHSFLIKEDSKRKKFIILFFLSINTFQPSIVRNSFDTLNCREFYPDPGKEFLKINLLIDCNDPYYLYWRNFFIIPKLIIFCIYFPSVTLLYIWRKKRKSKTNELILTYGFLFQSFGLRKYYW